MLVHKLKTLVYSLKTIGQEFNHALPQTIVENSPLLPLQYGMGGPCTPVVVA